MDFPTLCPSGGTLVLTENRVLISKVHLNFLDLLGKEMKKNTNTRWYDTQIRMSAVTECG
jgi:hypothetical protein